MNPREWFILFLVFTLVLALLVFWMTHTWEAQ